MALDDRVGDSEAEAAPTQGAIARGLAAVEAVKDALVFLHGNPGAVVIDADRELVADSARWESDPAGMALGVGEKVADDLRELIGVCDEHSLRQTPDLDLPTGRRRGDLA